MNNDQRLDAFSEDRLDPSLALQAAGLGAWRILPLTHYLRIDQLARTLLNVPDGADSLRFPQLLELIHPEDQGKFTKAWERLLVAPTQIDETIRIMLSPNQVRSIRYWGQSYFSPEGQFIGSTGLCQEVKNTASDKVIPIREVDQWLSLFFEQAPLGIALLEGPTYILRFANTPFQQIWNLSGPVEEVLNRPVFEAFPGIAGLGLEELLEQVRATHQPVGGEEQPAYFIRNGVSELAYVNFVYAPLLNTLGQEYIVVVATDVTEMVLARQEIESRRKESQVMAEVLTRNNEQLSQANIQLSRSNELLQSFAYVASHDLQEPLRKIQQFVDLLRPQLPDENQVAENYLNRVQASARRMSELMQALLEFSQVPSRVNSPKPVSLAEVLEEVVLFLELPLKESQAELLIEPLPTIWGQKQLLIRLFQNLLSNAIKFSRVDRSGATTIPRIQLTSTLIDAADLSLKIHPAQKAPQYIRIDVMDNGVGFDPEYLPRMFQIFQRLHSKSEYSGNGIGLAISEKIVTSMGGAITAYSQLGKGATFQVFFPNVQKENEEKRPTM
ncbi:sensor histidine kinase [Siphonobacter sp.]|uniref:sensor histidine kinase n=1 Tax=Siphonobacter sp. TaxID=1869184 RepID=UPI003B3AA01A